MPLTPQDVAAKQFTVTRFGKTGYDEAEVDAFLDEVQAEIARLLTENAELRARLGEAASAQPWQSPVAVAAHQSGHAVIAQVPSDDPVADDTSAAEAVADPHGAPVAETLPEPAAAPESAPAFAATPATESAPVAAEEPAAAAVETATAHAPGVVAETTSAEAALRTLVLAQRTADDLLATARADADRIRGESAAAADALMRDAEVEAAAIVRDARAEAAQMVGAATAERDQTLADLAVHRAALERQVDDLRSFEREYRARLGSYLQDQLSALDGRGLPDVSAGA